MRVVAIVPAKDRADSITATVSALLSIDELDDVVVVDDGSRDATASLALSAGASVVSIKENVGKGGAVAVALADRPTADVYLLVDADLGDTAVATKALLGEVTSGHLDMAIAIPVEAAGRGGFGLVNRAARSAIQRSTSQTLKAPLSGQRAVNGELLRSIELAPRFGLEVAMTIDLLRLGCRFAEIEAPIEHHHMGRTIKGFLHRAGQGRDIVSVLLPRLGIGGTLGSLASSLRSRSER